MASTGLYFVQTKPGIQNIYTRLKKKKTLPWAKSGFVPFFSETNFQDFFQASEIFFKDP